MKEKKYEFDQIFKALGDKHRIQILNMLIEKERNAGELLEAVDVVQSTLSHHMKSLSESGLVQLRKSGKWTYYSVSQAAIGAAREFLGQYLTGEGGEKKKEAPGAAEAQENGKKADAASDGAAQKKEAKAKTEKKTVQSHQSKNSQDIFAPAEGKKEKKGGKKEHEDVFAPLPVKGKNAEKERASMKNEASKKKEEKKKKSGKNKKEKKKKDKK